MSTAKPLSPPMTKARFALIARLMRSRGKVREASRRVLVEGESQKIVSDELAIEYHLVTKALIRYRKVHSDIAAAYLTDTTSKK